MLKVEGLVIHDFIPNPLGPNARYYPLKGSKIPCVNFGAMKIIPGNRLHQEYLTIDIGITSD